MCHVSSPSMAPLLSYLPPLPLPSLPSPPSLPFLPFLPSCHSGVDVDKVLEYFNVQMSVATKGASTFAIAYILHKLFLPVRATITVASVPLIVRWLRARGWIKGVAKQPK